MRIVVFRSEIPVGKDPQKRIHGIGMEAFEKEPLLADGPLMELENVILTPHIAFRSEESPGECT